MKSLSTALLLAASFSATSLQAAPLVAATDPEQIAQMIRGFGSATLETDEYGDPLITGRINGSKYGVYFYNCEDNSNCKTIQFSAAWAGYDVSLRQMNEWNQSQLYGTAYLDEDGDPNIDLVVNLRYGVSHKNFDDTIDWWVLAMKEFEAYIAQDN